MADRWHLCKNLSDALEAWLGRHRSYLTDEVQAAGEAATLQIAATWQLTPTQAKAHKARRTARAAQFEKAASMRKQGLTNEVISSEVRVSIRILRRWTMMSELPERKKSGGRRSILDPYKPYVEKRYLPRAAALLFTCSAGKLGKVGKGHLDRLLATCPEAGHCYTLILK